MSEFDSNKNLLGELYGSLKEYLELVIADQHAAVNTFPGFVHTARQTMKVGNTRSR